MSCVQLAMNNNHNGLAMQQTGAGGGGGACGGGGVPSNEHMKSTPFRAVSEESGEQGGENGGADAPKIIIDKPGPHDVILGRGGGTNNVSIFSPSFPFVPSLL